MRDGLLPYRDWRVKHWQTRLRRTGGTLIDYVARGGRRCNRFAHRGTTLQGVFVFVVGLVVCVVVVGDLNCGAEGY